MTSEEVSQLDSENLKGSLQGKIVALSSSEFKTLVTRLQKTAGSVDSAANSPEEAVVASSNILATNSPKQLRAKTLLCAITNYRYDVAPTDTSSQISKNQPAAPTKAAQVASNAGPLAPQEGFSQFTPSNDEDTASTSVPRA